MNDEQSKLNMIIAAIEIAVTAGITVELTPDEAMLLVNSATRAAELEKVLRMVEWYTFEGDKYCCWCEGLEEHKPHCLRQKALGEA